jgi:hypothetical protein
MGVCRRCDFRGRPTFLGKIVEKNRKSVILDEAMAEMLLLYRTYKEFILNILTISIKFS